MTGRVAGVALMLLPWCVSGRALQAQEVPASSQPWRATHGLISTDRDNLSARIEEAHGALLERVKSERPDLLARLEPEPPKPIPIGYGILPRLDPDPPEEAGPPSESRYDMSDLAAWVARERGFVAELSAKISQRTAGLDGLVDDYLLRAENFRRIDSHLAYHAFWQAEASRNPAFFNNANELLAAYCVWRTSSSDEAARRRLEDEITQFHPNPSLNFQKGADGVRVMKVRIATDIPDEGFLGAFAEGIDRTWNQAEAMRNAGVRIELAWDRRRPESLYPEGPPAQGAAIDTLKHLERFGPEGFVLTTGAASLHVWGRAIFLGPQPTMRRTMSHEFSHLLGFSDGYLRAFEGSPDSSQGVVWLEINPFPEDLVSNPGRGKVTQAMVRRFLAAYGEPAPGQR